MADHVSIDMQGPRARLDAEAVVKTLDQLLKTIIGGRARWVVRSAG